MRVRILAVGVLLLSVLGVGAVATRGDSAMSGRQSAVVYLTEPTLIGSTIVQGPVLFVHDESKMKRGEPCTTVRLFEPGSGPLDEIASFQCVPTNRKVVNRFTVTTRPNDELGFGCVLTEYQFAGDAEGHGVPLSLSVRADH